MKLQGQKLKILLGIAVISFLIIAGMKFLPRITPTQTDVSQTYLDAIANGDVPQEVIALYHSIEGKSYQHPKLLKVPTEELSENIPAFSPGNQDISKLPDQLFPMGDGDKKITLASPVGQADIVTQIVVDFEKEQVPVGITEVKNVTFNLSPQAEGDLFFANPKRLIYQLKNSLPLGTRYTVSIDNTSFMFDTARPNLMKIFADNGDTAKHNTCYVEFNQPVDLNSLQSLSFMQIRDNKVRIPVTVTKYDQKTVHKFWRLKSLSPTRSYRFESVVPLPKGSEFLLALLPGIKSELGGLKSTELRHNQYYFDTPPVPMLKGIEKPYEGQLNPNSNLYLKFSVPTQPESLYKAVHIYPPDGIEIEVLKNKYSYTSLYLGVSGLKPRSNYVIYFSKPLLTEEDEPFLPKPHTLYMGDYSPHLSVDTGVVLQEKQVSPTYKISAINMKKANISAEPLSTPDQLAAYLSNEFDFYSNTTFSFSEMVPFSKALNHYTHKEIPVLSMVSHLKYPLAIAVKGDKDEYPQNLLIQYSNIGITAKFGYNDGLIWTNKLGEGTSYKNVKIHIYQNNYGKKQLKFSGVTNANGILRTPGLKTLGKMYTLFITAEKEDDFSVMQGSWNKGISNEDFNLYSQVYRNAFGSDAYVYPSYENFKTGEKKVRAVFFTERKLYTPGEDVNFKVVLRQLGDSQLRPLKTGSKASMTVTDPKGEVIYKKTYAITRFSSIFGQFKIPEGAVLGNYTLTCRLEGEEYSYHMSHLQVQTFKTKNFNLVLSDQPESVSGETVKVDGVATYLQGGTMKHSKAKIWVRQSKTNYAPSGHPNYTFDNVVEGMGVEALSFWSQTLVEKTINTDDKGQISEPIPTIKKTFPCKVEIEMALTDLQGDELIKTTQLRLHPADYYVGIKNVPALVPANKALTLDLLAVKPNGEKIGRGKLKVSLYFKASDVLRYKSLGNTFLVKQDKKIKKIVEKKATFKNGEAQLNIIPPSAGEYVLVLESTDKNGRVTKASTSFSAYGLGDPQWQLYDHDRIDLEADKQSYITGDTAKILVKSPFTQGTALVTIERMGVLDHYTQPITNASPVIEVPIKESFAPNIYVSVTLIQGRISPVPKKGVDLGKPSFRVGYIYLPVTNPKNTLDVALKTDKEAYEPREEVTLDIDVSSLKTATKSDVAIAVVDEALLNLMPNKIDPLAVFYAPQALKVRTAQNRVHFKGRRIYGQKGVDTGGGGGMVSQKDIRDLFLNSVYWNPSVITDASGKATVSFKVPDNLTTFRVIAFAQNTSSQFGVNETTFKVAKPFALFNVFPHFLVQGDTFQAGVNIHNLSPLSEEASVSFHSENLTIKGVNTQTTRPVIGDVTPLRFQFEATDLGENAYRFYANMPPYQDAIKHTVNVKDRVVYEVAASYGRLQAGDLVETLKIPQIATANRGHIKVSLSASKLSAITGAVEYLQTYNHDCLEQRYAKTVGAFGAAALDNKTIKTMSKEDLRAIQTLIRETRGYFASDNGLKFWKNSFYSSTYLSFFVGDLWTLYQKKGIEIPNGYFIKLDSYFKSLFTHKQSTLKQQLMAFNYLAKRGKASAAMAERLIEKKQAFSLTDKLLLVEGMAHVKGQRSAAKQLFNECKQSLSFEAGEAFFDEKSITEWNYMIHPSLYLNILGLQTMLTMTPDDPLVFELAQYLSSTQKQAGFWRNTQENAQMILALMLFREMKESASTVFQTSVILDKAVLGSYSAVSVQSPPKDFSEKITDNIDQPISLTLATTGAGSGYYRTEVRYAVPAETAVKKNHGFQVNRRYFDVQNKPVATDAFKAGKLYRVEVTMRITERKDFIVLEDYLPGGFTAINPVLGGSDTLLKNEFKTYFRNPSNDQWIEHQELRLDRASAYGSNLRDGTYVFNYFVRALHPGTYTAIAPHAEEMYSPEVFGNGNTDIITISQ